MSLTEKDRILKLQRSWIEAENMKNVEKVMTYMADDIILHIANIHQFKGKEALREPLTDYIKNRLISTTKESTKIEVSKEGDLAYDIGTSVAVVKSLQGPKEVHQKYLDVWKKMNGEWKCVASSWSSSERE